MKVTIRETFGAAKTYMNQVFLFEEVPVGFASGEEPDGEMAQGEFTYEEGPENYRRQSQGGPHMEEGYNDLEENEEDLEFGGEEITEEPSAPYNSESKMQRMVRTPETEKSKGANYQNLESIISQVPGNIYENNYPVVEQDQRKKSNSRPKSDNGADQHRNGFEEIMISLKGVEQSLTNRHNLDLNKEEKRSLSRESALSNHKSGFNANQQLSERQRRVSSSKSHASQRAPPLHPNIQSNNLGKQEENVEKMIEEKLSGFEIRMMKNLQELFREKGRMEPKSIAIEEESGKKRTGEDTTKARNKKEGENQKLSQEKPRKEAKGRVFQRNEIQGRSQGHESPGESKSKPEAFSTKELSSCRQKLNYDVDSPLNQPKINKDSEQRRLEDKLQLYIDQKMESFENRVESLLQKAFNGINLANEEKSSKKEPGSLRKNKSNLPRKHEREPAGSQQENSNFMSSRSEPERPKNSQDFLDLEGKCRILEEELKRYQERQEQLIGMTQGLQILLENGIQRVETKLDSSFSQKMNGIEARFEEHQQSNELFKERVVDEMANLIQTINKLQKNDEPLNHNPRTKETNRSKPLPYGSASSRAKETQNDYDEGDGLLRNHDKPLQITKKIKANPGKKPEKKESNLKQTEKVVDLLNALQEKLAVKVTQSSF